MVRDPIEFDVYGDVSVNPRTKYGFWQQRSSTTKRRKLTIFALCKGIHVPCKDMDESCL